MLLKTEFSHAQASSCPLSPGMKDILKFFFFPPSQRQAEDPAAVCTWPLQEIKPPAAKIVHKYSYVTLALLKLLPSNSMTNLV